MVQVVNCKCGKTFAGSAVPYCYEDKDWLKDLKKYIKKGYEVLLKENNDVKFERCICVQKKRGGKRPNAGRPTTERKPFQVRCRPENINEIRIWIKTNKL